jgi:hypothetical protein
MYSVKISIDRLYVHLEKTSVETALVLLTEYFASIEARGPTEVAKEDGTIDTDYQAFLKQDSFQRVQELLTSLEFKEG